MSTSTERAAIIAALDKYRELLDTIPDEQFDVTPPQGGWSYAEVYSHILTATLSASISVEKCTFGNSRSTSKGPTLLGRLSLLFGTMPPGSTKLLPELAAKMAPKKITKEEARNLIIRCRQRVDGLVSALRDAKVSKRMEHPRLGMLNGFQWFKFLRIHLKHHIKQLGRIKNNFARN